MVTGQKLRLAYAEAKRHPYGKVAKALKANGYGG